MRLTKFLGQFLAPFQARAKHPGSRAADIVSAPHAAPDGENADVPPSEETRLREQDDGPERTLLTRLALIAYLENHSRLDEAIILAGDGMTLWPDAPELPITLARCQVLADRQIDAGHTLRALLKANPTLAHGWLEYARLLRSSIDPAALPPSEAHDAFARVAEHAGTNLPFIETAARYFVDQSSFAQAAKTFHQYFAVAATEVERPELYREYARCLRAIGQADEAESVTERGLAISARLMNGLSGEGLELARREHAQLCYEAGRTAEGDDVLRSMRAQTGDTRRYDRPEYLPDSAARIEKLRTIIGRRDVVIFLQGPSFGDFASHFEKLKDADFVSVTISSFPPVEARLMQALGRGADLLFISQPSSVRSWYTELEAYLGRRETTMFLSTHYALSKLETIGDDAASFVRRHDDRLLFCHPEGGPPVPSRPLHFETGNTLSCLLPLIVLGRPRRIFLVGADGGGHPEFNRPYFYYNDIDNEEEQEFLERPDIIDYRDRPNLLSEVNDGLRIDANQCDRIYQTMTPFLAKLFDAPAPPIYNVCPHSAHSAFPKIDVARAVDLLSGARDHDRQPV